MKIKNINGTSQNTCSCGSWLEALQKFSGQTTRYCAVNACLGTDLVGAHVQQSEGYDSSWYICPLGSSHNQSKSELENPPTP